MARSGLWSSLKSVLRKKEDPLFLNDSSAFDFSDEAGDEEYPRFNKLRVVVSDDTPDGAADASANGAHLGSFSDDSLLDRDAASPRAHPAASTDPCHNCDRQRELLKQRTVKRRLILAAALYLLFMAGELVGKQALPSY